MSGPGSGFRRAAGLLLAGSLVSVPACEDPPPSVPTPLPPPPEPLPEHRPRGPFPVVSRCEDSEIRVGAPRRVDVENAAGCSEAYDVDFVVEGSPGDAMLLDTLQAHPLRNWRVEAQGERVRHQFTLRMDPFWRTFDGLALEVPGSHQAHEPTVVQLCPEGEGAGEVLACTTTGCGIYDDVSEVPPLMPSKLELAITVPSKFYREVEFRVGETVEIPLTFQIFRPLLEDTGVVLELDIPPEYLEQVAIRIEPAEMLLPAGTQRTETRVARLTATRREVPRNSSVNVFFDVFLKPWGVPHAWFQAPRCINPPSRQARVRGVPVTPARRRARSRPRCGRTRNSRSPSPLRACAPSPREGTTVETPPAFHISRSLREITAVVLRWDRPDPVPERAAIELASRPVVLPAGCG